MLKTVVWALLACGALSLFFVVTRVPFPTVFTAPIVIVVAWIGAELVRQGKRNRPYSLCLALGASAAVAGILWLFQTLATDLWFGAGIVFVVVFGAEFIPRKKETGAADLQR